MAQLMIGYDQLIHYSITLNIFIQLNFIFIDRQHYIPIHDVN